MTPKEKAEELFYKMSTNSSDEYHHCTHYVAKNCALIAVDEILWEIIKYADNSREYVVENSLYCEELKKEIQNL